LNLVSWTRRWKCFGWFRLALSYVAK